MVIADVVLAGFAGIGTVIIFVCGWIWRNGKESDIKYDQIQRDQVTHAKELAIHQSTHAKDLTHYQLQTEQRLGEYIRREELNNILDRYEERMARQLNEMKEIIKEWMQRHDT